MTGLGGMHISTRAPTAARPLLGSLSLILVLFLYRRIPIVSRLFFGDIMGYPALHDSLHSMPLTTEYYY